MCDKGVGSQAGEPCAPEAGDWFDFQAKMLAQNGNFAALAPTRAGAETTGAFQTCRANDCLAGYECVDNGAGVLRCMPNAGTVAVSEHNAVFATALKHARATA